MTTDYTPSIHDQLVATADDSANHVALLKILERKGVIDKEDLKAYCIERGTAKVHVVVLASVLALARS